MRILIEMGDAKNTRWQIAGPSSEEVTVESLKAVGEMVNGLVLVETYKRTEPGAEPPFLIDSILERDLELRKKLKATAQ